MSIFTGMPNARIIYAKKAVDSLHPPTLFFKRKRAS